MTTRRRSGAANSSNATIRATAVRRRKNKPSGFPRDRYIKNALREIWGWSPEKRAAKERARLDNAPDGEHRWKCEICEAGPLGPKERDIDHLDCVENPAGWDGWDLFIGRLFCPPDRLIVLCKACHQRKTVTENAGRRLRKKIGKVAKESD